VIELIKYWIIGIINLKTPNFPPSCDSPFHSYSKPLILHAIEPLLSLKHFSKTDAPAPSSLSHANQQNKNMQPNLHFPLTPKFGIFYHMQYSNPLNYQIFLLCIALVLKH
jgi:hypothetical protein